MTEFKELMLKNPDSDFAVHVQNKQELEELVVALEELGFEYALPFLGTISEMAEQFANEDGYDGCWRVSREKGVAYNPSVEHWRLYTNDIVEKRGGEIVFFDGYTKQAAEIEKNKLRRQFFEDDDKDVYLRQFGLENRSRGEIERWLEDKFNDGGADCE